MAGGHEIGDYSRLFGKFVIIHAHRLALGFHELRNHFFP